MKPRMVKVSAPGKVILSGEHAVVYGYPAILAAVDKRISIELDKAGKRVKPISLPKSGLLKYALKRTIGLTGINPGALRIKIDSRLPIGSGMGSSAALSVALVGAFYKLTRLPWDLKKINEIGYEIEKKHHGNPSGGDNTISTYGGFLWYRKEAENFKIFFPVKPKRRLGRIFLVNTGKPIETTGEMVSLVAERYKKNPEGVKKLLEAIANTTKSLLRYILEEEKSSLVGIFKENERYLEQLGVVSQKARKIIRVFERIGAGAKITGAGGKKDGSGMILIRHPDEEKIIKFAEDRNLDILSVRLGEEGVRVEKEI